MTHWGISQSLHLLTRSNVLHSLLVAWKPLRAKKSAQSYATLSDCWLPLHISRADRRVVLIVSPNSTWKQRSYENVTLFLLNAVSNPEPLLVVSQHSVLLLLQVRVSIFFITWEVFGLHADVENGFGFPAGQLGEMALTVIRDEIWILTALPVVCAWGTLVTCQGQNS